MFRQTGFLRLEQAAGKEFTFQDITSDIDDLFINQNVLVLAEYTASNESNVAVHLRKKHFLYEKVRSSSEEFVGFLKKTFPRIARHFPAHFENQHIQLRIVYASRYAISAGTKAQVPGIVYLDYAYVRYFANVASTVKRSARFELLDFLQVKPGDYGPSILAPVVGTGGDYEGAILPEAHSHFPKGFKVVSFYVDAETLLSRVYVRRDGWRSGSNVYQRMISRKKVDTIRKHLLDGNAVFVNNVIVTLPNSTKLLDEKKIQSRSLQSKRQRGAKLRFLWNSTP